MTEPVTTPVESHEEDVESHEEDKDQSRVLAGLKAAATRRARREALAAGAVASVVTTPAPVPVAAPPVSPEAKPAAPVDAAASLAALHRLEKDLNRAFPERREVVRGCLLAIVARQHALLLGPPGTAKSMLINTLAEALALSRFEKLLTAYTDPSEIFGPLDVAALKEGRRSTITRGMAPEAHVVILDEIFKANSAILNSLLSLLNERVFHNGEHVQKCPLVSVFGASNEGPQDESLLALYDRLFLRFYVDYLASDDNMLAVLRAGKPKVVQLSPGTIEAAQSGAMTVTVAEETDKAILEIRTALKQENVVVSDRRWVQSRGLVKAAAWLDGDDTAFPEHLGFLADVLWTEPEQRPVVKRVVAQYTNSEASKAQEIVLAAKESLEQVKRYSGYDRGMVVNQGAIANGKLDEMLKKLGEMEAGASKRQRQAVTDALVEVKASKAELVALLKRGAAKPAEKKEA